MNTANAKPTHFLELTDFSPKELEDMLELALRRKQDKPNDKPFDGIGVAGIFDKRSVRTIESFSMGLFGMGGLMRERNYDELKIGIKESAEHVAGTLSQYFGGIVIRVSDADMMRTLAEHATIPVINAMTDESHPCQIMADMLTIKERLGTPRGKKIVFAGDCNNNIARTYQQAAPLFGFELVLSGPQHVTDTIEQLPQGVRIEQDLKKAVHDADVIVTDVWTSMGQEGKEEAPFLPYQINADVMKLAKHNALFMHCMPISPGYATGKPKEVTTDVLQSRNSVILQEAGNRMYAQNAIMLRCLTHM